MAYKTVTSPPFDHRRSLEMERVLGLFMVIESISRKGFGILSVSITVIKIFDQHKHKTAESLLLTVKGLSGSITVIEIFDQRKHKVAESLLLTVNLPCFSPTVSESFDQW